jgi:PKD repeat protein
MLNFSPKFRLLILAILFVGFNVGSISAQVIRCGTMEADSALRANDPNMESRQQFENWMQNEIMAQQSMFQINGVYTIPVVFHIIHSGEAVGSGTNISQAALQSQIDVLNEDFRKLFGSNGYNTNPVGADCQIEFCLAQRRPDGSAFPVGQPGVNRILYSTITGTAPPYSAGFMDATIKPWTYNGGVPTATRGWDPGKYLNIWIADLSGGLLGYAQFPQSPLGGMGCGTPALATDGVVFLYSSIGKSAVTGFSGPYAEGRTATHEIGHWLGLRHIWGDVNNCATTTDYCNDTPTALNSNFGCPTGLNSCTGAPDAGPDMIENYMDYTDDLCMNVFTFDQKQRMRTVLTATPLRMSLITSDACIPPNPSDASVVGIINPLGDNCPGALTPQVTIKNRGSNNLTSATVNYTIDNGTVTTFSFSGSIAPGATANVTFPAFTTTLGTHTFKSYTTLPNGVADPNTLYDTTSIQFAISNGYMGPYTQDFESQNFPPDVKWTSVNVSNDCTSWMGESAVSSAGVLDNNAAMVRYFDVTSVTEDYLYTPIFILPCNATVANFTFDVAYRRRNGTSVDRLRVEISTDCGVTWVAAPVYDKQAAVLASVATNSTTSFVPSSAAQWRNETVNLISFVGATSKNIKLRFRATGTVGNVGPPVTSNSQNIWIDNYQFNTTTPGEANVLQGINTILDGGAYSFGTTSVGTPVNATFTVQNTGTTNLILTPPITITGTAFNVNTSFGATTIPAGGSTTFTITFNPPASGFYNETLSFATNDCDEATYNFQLTGTGTGGAPVAAFNGTPTTVCIGQNVTFTDLSTGAVSWSWNFGAGATPATANTQGPHVVTYSTAGSKTVALTVNGTTTNTQTNYITVNAPPTTANAGVDQTVCAATATMAGNIATTGTGAWTFIGGPAIPTITTPASPTSGITGMSSAGVYTFQWTITNAPCTASSDQMTITRNAVPTTSAAGPDQTICASPGSATMAGNTPATGTGTWSQISGPVTGTITTPSSPTTTITGLTTAGIYVFQWQIANAPCTASNDQIQVTVNASPTTANAGVDQTVCAATATMAGNTATTGVGTWTFIGGPAVPTITTPASPTSGITGMSVAGTYTFQWTITNAPCTASSDQMTITRNTVPTTSAAGPDQTICASPGSATMAGNTPATGTGTWSQISGPVTGIITTPSSPTTTITGLTTAGIYVFQWQIVNAPCTASNDQIQVTVNASPTTANAGVDQTVCAATATMAGNTATSGTGAWTFIGGPAVPTITTPSSPTSGITGMSVAGTYTFQWTITNAPCTASSDQMTITRNAVPTTSAAGPDQSICTSPGSATMAGNTPVAGTGSWSQISGPVTGTITTPSSPTTTITGLTTVGTYVFQWTIANAPCTASSDQIQVTVTPGPTTANAGSDQTICSTSGSATMAANTAVVGTGSWTQIGGPVTGTITTPSSPTTTITGMTTAGVYVYQWNINNAPCTASTDQIQVTVNAPPTGANAGPDQNICANSATMAANTATVGIGTWTQTGGPVTGTITSLSSPITTITGLTSAGTYTFQWTITNAPCTATSDQMQVVVSNPPTSANAGIDQTICSTGGSATMAGNVAVTGTGTWTQTGGPVTGTITTPSSPTTTISGLTTAGTYMFQWTITNAPCTASADQMQVTVNAPPSAANAGVDQTICSSTSSMAANIPATGTGAWSFIGGPVTPTITTPGSPSSGITGMSSAGVYTFQWTITNAPCTASSDQVSITISSSPTTANAGPDQNICSGLGATTMAANTPIIGAGSWTQTGGPLTAVISTPSSPTTSITGMTTNGTYVFQWNITNGSCAASTDQVQIIVGNGPTVSITGTNTICNGTSTTLTASGATNYTWNTGPLTPGITVSPSTTTNYFVVGSDPSGCSDTAFQTVTVNLLPSIGISGNASVCTGSSDMLTATGASSYVWNFGPTTSTVIVSPTIATTYTVTGTDVNNCMNTATITVSVNSLPIVSAGPDVLICPGATTTLTATGGIGYVWNNGIGSGNPVNVSPVSTTTYIVQGSDINNCSGLDTVTVTVSILPVVIFNPLTDTICINAGMLPLSGSPSGGSFAGTGVSGTNFDPFVAGTGMFSLSYTVMNADNCPASDNEVISVIGCAGIEDNQGMFVDIYPNPSDAFVNIVSSDIIERIEIYDMLGKMVIVNGNDNQNLVLSLQEFTNGVYTFRIHTVKGIVVKRVVRK